MTEIHYTDPEQFPEEIVVEKSLRPSQFDEFIGQKELIDNLRLYIRASNNREDALDHVLITSFLPDSILFETFFSKLCLTNGPFFNDLGMTFISFFYL